MSERKRAFEVGHSSKGSEQEPLSAEALFRAHAGFVASFLRRLGVASADVDDLTQEVFVVAHRKGGFIPGTGQPRSWLAAIAVRIASTHRRSRSRRHEDGGADLDVERSPSPDPAQALESRRALLRVQRALDTLSLEDRATFVLFELDGWPCDAIATAFGIPVGTAYSRLHNARKRFAEAHARLERDDSAVLRLRLAGT